MVHVCIRQGARADRQGARTAELLCVGRGACAGKHVARAAAVQSTRRWRCDRIGGGRVRVAGGRHGDGRDTKLRRPALKGGASVRIAAVEHVVGAATRAIGGQGRVCLHQLRAHALAPRPLRGQVARHALEPESLAPWAGLADARAAARDLGGVAALACALAQLATVRRALEAQPTAARAWPLVRACRLGGAAVDARMQKAQVGLHSRGRTQRSHQRHCGRVAWTGWSRGFMLGKCIQYGNTPPPLHHHYVHCTLRATPCRRQIARIVAP